MSHDIPTGPAVVGHEHLVLPARIRMSRRMSGTRLVITAPQCRYGQAIYSVNIQSAALAAQGRPHPNYWGLVKSGRRFLAHVPASWRDYAVMLRLLNFTLDRGAFDALTDEELTEALRHELSDVREAAFLAIQRPRTR